MILLAMHMAYGHKWILNIRGHLCSAVVQKVKRFLLLLVDPISSSWQSCFGSVH